MFSGPEVDSTTLNVSQYIPRELPCVHIPCNNLFSKALSIFLFHSHRFQKNICIENDLSSPDKGLL